MAVSLTCNITHRPTTSNVPKCTIKTPISITTLALTEMLLYITKQKILRGKLPQYVRLLLLFHKMLVAMLPTGRPELPLVSPGMRNKWPNMDLRIVACATSYVHIFIGYDPFRPAYAQYRSQVASVAGIYLVKHNGWPCPADAVVQHNCDNHCIVHQHSFVQWYLRPGF